MPLQIIRQDITKVVCDAIVNPSNERLIPGGGVDEAIHKAAGHELLDSCRIIGECPTGQARITPGFDLPCKYVIHTAGPIWRGGGEHEKEKLESCYREAMKLALINGCESIAFPLISSGVYGYPKDKVLKLAVNVISEYLMDNELMVYVVVFDKTSYEFSAKLFSDIKEFIDDGYADFKYNSISSAEFLRTTRRRGKVKAHEEFPVEPNAIFAESDTATPNLSDWLKQKDERFSVTLLKLISERGMTDVECYKKANVGKKTFWKIMNQDSYKPSKNTVIAFSIALRLTLDETQALLATVGFTLSDSIVFDRIIKYYLINGEYDIFVINESLFEFDQVCLGVSE